MGWTLVNKCSIIYADMNKNEKRFQKVSFEPKDYKSYRVKNKMLLLDFLREEVKGVSRNNLKSFLKYGQVLVNGVSVHQFDYQVNVHDEIIILKKRPHYKELVNDDIHKIYEDEDVIAIEKPEGILSVASDKEKVVTSYAKVSKYLMNKDKHAKCYVIHRLDKNTSGVLVFAKKLDVAKAFQEKWNELVIKRGYYAIVTGKMKKEEDTFKDYLFKNNLDLMYVDERRKGGKLSITHYKVMKTNSEYSLLDVSIMSGRKNQIRVQLGHRGHYVIGDDKYGEPPNPINRLGLHAYELKIKHPLKDKIYDFKSKMPDIFLSIFKR